MLISVVNGATSIVARVKILTQASAYPSGLTGLTFSSAGLIISTIADNEATPTVYTAAGSTIETVTTLGTYAAPTATKCRFKEVDATNHPGVYEIQLANARYAVSSAKYLLVSIAGTTTNLIQSDAIVTLPVFDPYSSSNAVGVAASVSGAVGSVTGNVGGNVSGSIGSVTGSVGSVSGTVGSVLGNVGGNIVGNVNGNVVGSVASVAGTVGSVLGNVGGTVATVTNLTNAPTAGDLTATMKTSVQTAAGAGLLVTPANLLATDGTGRVIVQYPIEKNKAINNFQFPMTLTSDHISPYTGAGNTVTGKVVLDGTSSTLTNSASVAIVAGVNGVYVINLAAADLNGNSVCLIFSAATCDDTKIFFTTQA